jgi:hypothetical protein
VTGLKTWAQDQATPLHMALVNGREDAANALIEAGADLNVQCLEVCGVSPLVFKLRNVAMKGLDREGRGESYPRYQSYIYAEKY